eukprot:8437170-Alexandrium_andersonii.AAC.1
MPRLSRRCGGPSVLQPGGGLGRQPCSGSVEQSLPGSVGGSSGRVKLDYTFVNRLFHGPCTVNGRL